MIVTLRRPGVVDAEALCALLTRNRTFFASGEPLRPDDHYTPDGQAAFLRAAEAARAAGTAELHLVEVDGVLAGRAHLNSIIRGAFQSASVAYLIDERQSGRGVATAAVRLLIGEAFGRLGLHRLQAETLTTNAASRRVLQKCGFVHYGTAPDYLRIDGRWQANDLFQLINADWRE